MAELDTLVAEARALQAGGAGTLKLDAYELLAASTSQLGDQDGDLVVRAAKIATLHREHRAHAGDQQLPLRSIRVWAQASLEAGDLAQLAAAADAGRLSPDQDALQRGLLLLLEARLHAQIGRLDTARDLVDQASTQLAIEATTATGHRQATLRVAERDRAMAAADCCLLASDPDGAELAVTTLPQDRTRRLYTAIAMALRGRSEAIPMLAQVVQEQQGPERQLASSKLVQLLLQLGQDDAALQHLGAVPTGSPTWSEDPEGRQTTLRMELALRGKLPVDDRLRQQGRAALDKLLGKWSAVPALRGGIGFLHIDDRATLVQNLMRVEAELAPDQPARAALAILLRVHATSCGLPQRPTEEVLSQFVGIDRGIVALVPGRFGSLALSFDSTGGTIVPLAGSGTLRQLGDQLHLDASRLLQSPELKAEDLAALTRSARRLLPDLLATRLNRCKQLTVCGAGTLDSLPFDLLPHGAEDVPRGLRQAIAYEENLILGAKRPPLRAEGDLAFLGSLLGPAPGTEPMAMPKAAVEACLEGLGARQLLDGRATPRAVLQALLRARILHLVAHGTYRSERMDPNGMAFGPGPKEQLFGADFDGLDLRGQLVILGACSLGRNPQRRGGDPLSPSLAGAILRADARCVLTATTEIELFRHLTAMRKLYTALASGLSPAAALLETRQAAASPIEQLELLLMQLHGRGD
ncbi:MAG: CHAT domain-containing protein [Planctomycetes bacterium]|nr:CHAT domain-containing protein [Planctomycetota bacterium]